MVDITITGGSIDTTGSSHPGINLFNVNGFAVSGVQVNKASGDGISVGQYAVTGGGAIDGTIAGCRVFNSNQGGRGATA